MGKKTSEKITTIRKELTALGVIQNQWFALEDLKEKEIPLKDKAMQAYQTYYSKKKYDTQLEGREELMDGDNQLKKLWDTWEDKKDLLTRIAGQIELVHGEVKKQKVLINNLVDDLAAHVAKKEREKTFFWQKLSVNKAKQVIKDVRDLLA